MSTIIVYSMKAEATICHEGFCSAMLLWTKYGASAQYVQAMYHKSFPLERFKNQDVIFANFSYGRAFMDEIYKVANTLQVFSHQETIIRDLADAPYAVLDKEQSSCALIWNALKSEGRSPLSCDNLPPLIAHIDLAYRKSDLPEETRQYMAALSSVQSDFGEWKTLLERTSAPGSLIYLEFLHLGQSILALHNKHVLTVACDAFEIELCGVKGLAVNSNKIYASDLGHYLAKDSKTFGAVFYMRPDLSIEFSLRSSTVDVEQIAKFYGGGGHKESAGFSMTYSNFLSLLDPSRRTMDLCLKIDSILPAFSSPKFGYYRTPEEVADLIFIYMNLHIGHLAEDLDIQVEKTIVDKTSTLVKFGISIAKFFHLPQRDTRSRWYHYILPYIRRQEIRFDDQQIKELLELAACDVGGATNGFVADCLVKTVNIQYSATLPKKTAVFEVTVGMSGSGLRSQHTFEVTA